jgi:hypothetical protein
MSGREEGIMTPNVRKVISSVLIVSFIFLPEALLAKAKQGASLIVTLKDGSQTNGELIAVKKDSLVLLNPVGKDESVALADISAVTIAKPSKAGKGFLTGLLVGGIGGGIAGAAMPTDEGYQALAIVGGALVIGAIGGLIGFGLGAAAGTDETIEFRGLSEAGVEQVLTRLRGMARMPTAQ